MVVRYLISSQRVIKLIPVIQKIEVPQAEHDAISIKPRFSIREYWLQRGPYTLIQSLKSIKIRYICLCKCHFESKNPY